MDLFDYRVKNKAKYLSVGLTPGDSKRPVARGSKSSFNSPYLTTFRGGVVQFVMEPVHDQALCAMFTWKDDVNLTGNYFSQYKNAYYVVTNEDEVAIKYLQNGVYSIQYGDDITRVVTKSGPVTVKLLFKPNEIYVSIDGATLRIPIDDTAALVTASLSPTGGMLYDKFIYDEEVSVDNLIMKDPFYVAGKVGHFTPILRDKLYSPVLLNSEDMDIVDGYRVISHGMTLGNLTSAFYSDIDQIEKSTDAEEWVPVSSAEFQTESQDIYRSKDPDFSMTFFQTTMTEFIVRGATTTTTGDIYKVGDNIGSYFSHDGYKIINGGIVIESEGAETFSILGFIPDEVLEGVDHVIDYGGSNLGKVHLYTFFTPDILEVFGDEILISGIGVNMNHEDLLNNLTGGVEMSYADEIQSIEDGLAMNGDREYAILDLQWGL